jgi:ribonuclease P protein component
MLKKAFRLKKKEDFARVFRFGKPLFFKPYACKWVQNELGNDRLGFSFSKKHAKSAVLRNRLRRRMVGLYNQGYNFNGLDIVFFTTHPVEKLEIVDLEALFKKIPITKN